MSVWTLTLNCADAPGIVAAVTSYIHQSCGNILDSRQHYEELGNQFFMYVRFSADGCTESLEGFKKSFSTIAGEYDMTWQVNSSARKKRMAIMVSKYDHCLYDLLLRQRYGEFDVEVPLIMSNHKDLENVAEHFGIPFFHIPRNKENRVRADMECVKLFKEHDIDFAVMARYMQILTPVLLDEFKNRIINVHHGFLPAFKGAKPYHQAYAKGVKLIGASSHYATEELDMGPLIEQETERVGHSHTVEDLIAVGRDIETKVLATAVKAHIEDRISVYQNRTIVF